MGKKIEITMEDGSVWTVCVSTVVSHRDCYRSDSAEFFESHADEAVDWMKNNMNWKDLEASQVSPPKAPDYSLFFNCVTVVK